MAGRNAQILIAADYFLPGFRGGGPIRTLANLIDHLGADFDFTVITRDHDLGEEEPFFDGVGAEGGGAGRAVGKARVWYLPARRLTMGNLRGLLRSLPHDLLYLNSFFSVPFAIKLLLLRRLGAIPKVPVILAPRGEFSAGALAISPVKKICYLAAVKMSGMCRDITWQASSHFEEQDIRRIFGDRASVVVAPDLPAVARPNVGAPRRLEKMPGELRVLFLSRISPMKNLDGLLLMLNGMTEPIQLHIYGPVEDLAYWEKCRTIIQELPSNVMVEYQGAVAHGVVAQIFAEHDLFFLPTHGENFGHVILESLTAGCPVLISDQTPWSALEENGAGWAFPLNRPEFFQQALRECVALGAAEYRDFRKRAQGFARLALQDEHTLQANQGMFALALQRGR